MEGKEGVLQLQQFFEEELALACGGCFGARDAEVETYIAGVLVDFSTTDRLLAIRDAAGKSVSDIGTMLAEADPVFGRAVSFERERQVRKHMGDYALFMLGMFPDGERQFQRHWSHLNGFPELLRCGREGYALVAKFDRFGNRDGARLFWKMSDGLDRYVHAVQRVSTHLAGMGRSFL